MSLDDSPEPDGPERTIDEQLEDLKAQAGRSAHTDLATVYRAIYPALEDPEKRKQWVEALESRGIKCGVKKFYLGVSKYAFAGDGASGHTKKGQVLQYLVEKAVSPAKALQEIKDKGGISALAKTMARAKEGKARQHLTIPTKVSVEFEKLIRDSHPTSVLIATLSVRMNKKGGYSLEVKELIPELSANSVPDGSSTQQIAVTARLPDPVSAVPATVM